MSKNYLSRLKEKLKIKKIDSKQPRGAWTFVIVLNIIAFLGYLALNFYGIKITN